MSTPSSDAPASGQCLCGATRLRLIGAPLWIAHCHCHSCRKATGAPVTTYVGMRTADVEWLAGSPRHFASSPGVRRGACPTCSSPLTYESDRFPDEVHVHLSVLDAPQAFPPRGHVFWSERIAWFDTADGLPRFETTGSQGTAVTREAAPAATALGREQGKHG
ncbi:MAG: GFA family protein [Ectothiorhodospiraceae bacterium]|nr:GFA family protein [Chromatiales bacterium]MCP5156340.1 GFA family protein [Ectothiorhodospiraceae bacterium]